MKENMRTGNLPANMKKNRVLQIIPCKKKENQWIRRLFHVNWWRILTSRLYCLSMLPLYTWYCEQHVYKWFWWVSSSITISDDFNRVIISMRRGQEFTDYVNASFIDVSRCLLPDASHLAFQPARGFWPSTHRLCFKGWGGLCCHVLLRATGRRTTTLPARALWHTQWRISGEWCGNGNVTPLWCSRSSRRGSR